MSLLMDALKKAELAKQGGASTGNSPTPSAPVDKNTPEPENSALTIQVEEEISSLELTLDEAELDNIATTEEPAAEQDEPVLHSEMQQNPDNELTLPSEHSESIIKEQEIVQQPTPLAQAATTSSIPDTNAGMPKDQGAPLANEKPDNIRMQTPAADPQQLQRSFVLKSQAAARRKRMVLLTLGGVALLSLLAGGYSYYNHSLSTIGSSSLLVSDHAISSIPEEQLTESAEIVADELKSPDSPTQGTLNDDWPLPETVIAPLQQSDIAAQTASVQQPASIPSKATRDTNVNTPVRKPTPTNRVKPAPSKAAVKPRIHIVRANKTPPINQRLLEAYHAYQAGNDAQAEKHYHHVLNQEATNRDALLGLAAIAQRKGDREQAADYYITLLKYDPRDSTAISGLVSLQGASLTVENESRIKMLLDQEPQAAHLHFTLGTLYAGQSRWADAQQSFFNAHRYATDNADYAYNLAVSLDRIGKQATALEYYRRAVKLAGQQRVMFNLSKVNERVGVLAGLTDAIR